MLKNYFKVAFRNLWRHRVFSFINVMGLTIGMAAFFLIFLYVRFEMSYDSFNTKADRTYRIVCDIKTPTETLKASGPSWAVPAHIQPDFPEIEAVVRFNRADALVKRKEVKFQEENLMFVDSAVFRIFDFQLIKGDPLRALTEPMALVLSETAAKKYFGDTDPMGQTLSIQDDTTLLTVTGVMKDIPENSQIKADMFISMTTLTGKFNTGLDNQWGNYGLSAYVLLKPGSNAKALQAKLPAFLERHNGTEMKESQMFPTLYLERLRDVYLRSTRGDSKTGNINNVYIFSIVAIFILFIACINFVNLTTARSAERAREVGVRKVVGAGKGQLMRQFIGESLIVCLIAFLLTVGLVVLLIPLFNQLSGKIISHGLFEKASSVLILLGIAVGIGLLAGLYPALVLSSFRPITVLKGRFATGTRGILLRKGLVVTQFVISIALIIATLIVYNQLNYMQSRDLGFSKNQMMVIDTQNDPGKDAFRQSLLGTSGVRATTFSSSVPGGNNPGAYSEIENVKGDLQIANLDLYFVDFDYIPQYSIKVIAGRPFSKDFMTDTTQAMVINESAMKLFGYRTPQAAIGRRFKQWGREGKIIGVVKDFHFRSLQQDIKPLTMRIESGLGLLSINISSQHTAGTIAAIADKWKKFIPGRPFSYYFMDEFFDRQYRSEERFGKLFFNFAILAILISCLGLLGLASYSTMQRTKEIGIRKMMGASVGNILHLLSKEFLLLILVSFLVATPVTAYFMHRWLNDFAYNAGMSWWVFAVAGISAVLVAMATISFQAVKAAVTNPVKSLRTE